MLHFDQFGSVTLAQCLNAVSYGINLEDPNTSPLDFDSRDNWLGQDFDFYINNIFDFMLDEIESDLLTVWSTNLSEQQSQQASAQASADAEAAGMDTGTNVSGDTTSGTEGTASVDSSVLSSTSLDHSHDDHGHGKGIFHHPLESRYSNTNSKNSGGDTQGSLSHGTSDTLSILSTVSIDMVEHINFYENSNTTTSEINVSVATSVEILMDEDMIAAGISWEGDADNEIIFGTLWLDKLYGGGGDDNLYGFEDDDMISGGNGMDRLFGDAGDDIIWLGNVSDLGNANIGNPEGTFSTVSGGPSDNDFATGGSGNDTIIGTSGNDTIFGGPGHDNIQGHAGENNLFGNEGDDFITSNGTAGTTEINGGSGDDTIIVRGSVTESRNDIFGEEGNDTITGGQGADDIHGGPGDDIIDGRNGDDEIWGGEGNDIVKGAGNSQGTNMVDVVRGGPGNDLVYGGTDQSLNGGIGSVSGEEKWLYGDEGDDSIWGSNNITKQYIFGGEGDDEIQSGMNINENYIHGGKGDDVIRPASHRVSSWSERFGATEIVRGGEGNDVINPIVPVFDDNGDLDNTTTFGARYNRGHLWDGGEGDDIIWGTRNSRGGATYLGGNGDDTFYGAHSPQSNTEIRYVGQGGKDEFQLDFQGDTGRFRSVQLVWGDWGYGPEDDPYNKDLQYGDPNLERQLWGDDDVIHLHRQDNDSDIDGEHRFWAGDGDDIVYIGKNWETGYGYGGSGNDTFYLPETFGATQKFYGGDGNDTMLATPFDEAADNMAEGEMSLNGGAGDDWLESTFKTNTILTEGGDGNDKIIGGRQFTDETLIGQDGDDILHGGSDAIAGTSWVWGDQLFSYINSQEGGNPASGGNDRIYGGDNIVIQNLVGGSYDDIIYSGNNIASSIFVFGDNYGASFNDHSLDGDDLIDIGNHNASVYVNAEGGNDKIIGGWGSEQQEVLYGGDGDDKIWLVNPEEREFDNFPAPAQNFAYGNDGNDKIYGTAGEDRIIGDSEYRSPVPTIPPTPINQVTLTGGDDWLRGYGGDDQIQGGFGDDVIFGDEGDDELYGHMGDDKIYGGDGVDLIYGDIIDGDDPNFFGDDKLFGGAGDDNIYGGHGDDIIDGGAGGDFMLGGNGEDTIYGGDGNDFISGDTGWDTIFGQDGCD